MPDTAVSATNGSAHQPCAERFDAGAPPERHPIVAVVANDAVHEASSRTAHRFMFWLRRCDRAQHEYCL
jgi:hypothetical protein